MSAPVTWVVTLDGPAASGKSTVARLVAQALDASFLDTGATYRAATYAALQAGVDLKDSQSVLEVLRETSFTLIPTAEGMAVSINGQGVSEALRTPEVTAQVRNLAQSGIIRNWLVVLQQNFARQHLRIVTEGRDQGTVVFPNALLKIFLTASARERAQRRCKELLARGIECDIDRIEADIQSRDESDRNREVGPLKPAPDAVEVDTTGLTIGQVVSKIVDLLKERL
jgi:cytidylate kinase